MDPYRTNVYAVFDRETHSYVGLYYSYESAEDAASYYSSASVESMTLAMAKRMGLA